MSSTVLKPELVWIEGRCFRNTDTSVEVNTFQEHDLYENETVYKDSDDNDEDDDIEVVALDDSRYSTSFYVSKHYLGAIIGKRGYTKSRIEHDTKTEIKIPRHGKDGDITILGPSAANVKAARRRINMIVMSSRMKQKPTHFISIPVNNPDIVDNFVRFQETVLHNCQSRGVEESIFMKPNKVHLTLGVMCLMDNEERIFASKILTEAKEKVVMPLLQGHMPLKIKIKGLSYMNDDPKDINVLYANVEESESTPGILQQLADGVVDHFNREGLMKNQEWGRDNVKLHVTLLNSKYRNGSSQDGGAPSGKRESFDGSEILQTFGDFEFGVMELSEIHLSQRHAIGPDDVRALKKERIPFDGRTRLEVSEIHLSQLGATGPDGACMEEEETAAHVILACPGVAEYRANHLGTPGSLPEAVGNVKGLLGFLVELGWHE